ncbi:MAG: hypothetical protein HY876_06810 [Coriobacteriales bacterium]|nr:hypothetical protein [Coriobacteriales bacterium]
MVELEDIRQRTWDFGLTIATVVLLAGLGLQSFAGTIYVWWAQTTIPGWEQSSYGAYVEAMNAIAAPMLVGLVVVMGLCVPKRLLSRRLLLWASLAMVALGGVAYLASGEIAVGVAIYLGFAALIQIAVVALTLAGTRGPSYLTEGRLVKTGSGLLHLGFIVFGIVVAVLQNSVAMLPVFAAAAVLMAGGTAMSFYANRLSWRRHPESRHEHPIDF